MISTEGHTNGTIVHGVSRPSIIDGAYISHLAESLILAGIILINAALLIPYIRSSEIRKLTRSLLLGVLISCDLMQAFAVETFLQLRYGSLLYDLHSCVILLSFMSWVTVCTIVTLVVISVERLVAITNKARHDSLLTPRRVAYCLAVCWMLAAVLVAVPIFTFTPQHSVNASGCHLHDADNFRYRLYGLVIPCMILPFIFTFCVYGYVFYVAMRQLRLIRRVIHDDSFINSDRVNPGDNATTVMIAAAIALETMAPNVLRGKVKIDHVIIKKFALINLMYFLLNMPLEAYYTVEVYSDMVSHNWQHACTWLVTVHGLINPFLHAYEGRAIRYILLSTFKCERVAKDVVRNRLMSLT